MQKSKLSGSTIYIPYYLSDNSELAPQYTLKKWKTSSTYHTNILGFRRPTIKNY